MGVIVSGLLVVLVVASLILVPFSVSGGSAKASAHGHPGRYVLIHPRRVVVSEGLMSGGGFAIMGFADGQARPGYDCLDGWPNVVMAQGVMPSSLDIVDYGSSAYVVGPITISHLQYTVGSGPSSISLDTGVTDSGGVVTIENMHPLTYPPDGDMEYGIVKNFTDGGGEQIAGASVVLYAPSSTLSPLMPYGPTDTFFTTVNAFVLNFFSEGMLPYTGNPATAISDCVPDSWWRAHYPSAFQGPAPWTYTGPPETPPMPSCLPATKPPGYTGPWPLDYPVCAPGTSPVWTTTTTTVATTSAPTTTG